MLVVFVVNFLAFLLHFFIPSPLHFYVKMVFKLLILLILISSGFCAFVTPTNISSQGSSSRVVIIAGKLFGVKNDSLKTSWDRKKVPKNLVTSWISQPVDHQNPDKFPNWSQVNV